jgi:hypothetical protein
MVAVNELACVHCERRPVGNGLGLCAACNAVQGVRVLYLRRRGWTPEWEEHLRQLTRRAQARLPLFDEAR